MNREMEKRSSEYAAPDIDVQELFHYVYIRKRLILTITAVIFLLSAMYAFFWPPTYEASTTLKISEATNTDSGNDQQLSMSDPGHTSIETDIEIAQSESVALATLDALHWKEKPQYQKLNEGDLAKRLMRAVKVTSVKESKLIQIQASSRDPQESAELANAWAQSFVTVSLSLRRQEAQARYQYIHEQSEQMKKKIQEDESYKRNYLEQTSEAQSDENTYKWLIEQDRKALLARSADDFDVIIIDPAQAPKAPAKPNRNLCLAGGLFLGLLLGIQVVFIREKFRDHVWRPEDLTRASGLPLMAAVPDLDKIDKGSHFLLYPEKPLESDNPSFSVHLESLSLLRMALDFGETGKKQQALAVLASNAGEGSTWMNAHLALSLSHAGKRVLLADADFRHPSLARTFGIKTHAGKGLPALLQGKGTAVDMVLKSKYKHLWLLPHAMVSPETADLLGSDAMKKLILRLKQLFDYVIFDGAPLLPVVDSALLASSLDGVILLARSNYTRRADVRESIKRLRTVKAKVLGTVLNAVAAEKGKTY